MLLEMSNRRVCVCAKRARIIDDEGKTLRAQIKGGECCATRKSVAFFWVYHGDLYSREGEGGMVLEGWGYTTHNSTARLNHECNEYIFLISDYACHSIRAPVS